MTSAIDATSTPTPTDRAWPGILGLLKGPGVDAPDEVEAAEGGGGRPAASRWCDALTTIAFAYRLPLILATHAAIFAGVYLAAHVVRFDAAVPREVWDAAIESLPMLIGLKLVVLVSRGGHRGWWRYVNFADLAVLFEIATIGAVALALASWAAPDAFRPPRSVVVIDAAGTLLALGGLRAGVRLARERYVPIVAPRGTEPTLVIGAHDAGVALARELLAHPALGMRPIGFLDPDPRLRGVTLAGVPVLGSTADLERIAARRGATTVLIPTPATPARVLSDLVAACNASGLKPRVVPGLDALVNGRLDVRPRDVALEDLLGRHPVRLDDSSVAAFLRGKAVLVTGAAGSIGSEVCRQVLRFGPSMLVLYDQSETGLFHAEREMRGLAAAGTAVVACVGSIVDPARLRAVMGRTRPTVVFHAAALKHVPMMEADPGEAIKTNALGTRRIADAAVAAGVEAFVMVSTDKAVRPSSVMGATKRLAEAYVQSLAGRAATRMLTVRFGNVLGSNGSVVPIFQEQVRRGGPLTVTHPEMTRYFMTIPEAAQLVLQAGAIGRGGEIFVLDMGTPVRVADLARDIIRLSGLVEDRNIEIVFTGLRPGEKLHEELYDDSERRLPTPHPKIFAVAPGAATVERPGEVLDRFERLAASEAPRDVLLSVLRRSVPGYRAAEPPRSQAEMPSGAEEAPGVRAELFQGCAEAADLAR